MLMGKHCDHEVYKVVTQDAINHYSYAVSPDGIFNIFIDHMNSPYSLLIESQQEFCIFSRL
jgi:hypothetical protein